MRLWLLRPKFKSISLVEHCMEVGIEAALKETLSSPTMD
jgi:hypothetical protein